MKQRNNRGARTVACGTPDNTVAKLLYRPSTTTCCTLLETKLLSKLINLFVYHNGVAYEIGADGTLYRMP